MIALVRRSQKGGVIIFFIVAVFVILVVLAIVSKDDRDIVEQNITQETQVTDHNNLTNNNKALVVEEPTNEVEIGYFDSGFEPSDITIDVGNKVVFRNNSSRSFWPATDLHPSHKVYPGSGIKKCKDLNSEKIFDSCEPVVSGDSYSFVFDESGSWKFHDHMSSSLGGMVNVN